MGSAQSSSEDSSASASTAPTLDPVRDWVDELGSDAYSASFRGKIAADEVAVIRVAIEAVDIARRVNLDELRLVLGKGGALWREEASGFARRDGVAGFSGEDGHRADFISITVRPTDGAAVCTWPNWGGPRDDRFAAVAASSAGDAVVVRGHEVVYRRLAGSDRWFLGNLRTMPDRRAPTCGRKSALRPAAASRDHLEVFVDGHLANSVEGCQPTPAVRGAWLGSPVPGAEFEIWVDGNAISRADGPAVAFGEPGTPSRVEVFMHGGTIHRRRDPAVTFGGGGVHFVHGRRVNAQHDAPDEAPLPPEIAALVDHLAGLSPLPTAVPEKVEAMRERQMAGGRPDISWAAITPLVNWVPPPGSEPPIPEKSEAGAAALVAAPEPSTPAPEKSAETAATGPREGAPPPDENEA